jgi:hypothetical protein
MKYGPPGYGGLFFYRLRTVILQGIVISVFRSARLSADDNGVTVLNTAFGAFFAVFGRCSGLRDA